MVRFTVDNRNRLIFYGNPVGYVKEETAVVDKMFRTDELTLTFCDRTVSGKLLHTFTGSNVAHVPAGFP